MRNLGETLYPQLCAVCGESLAEGEDIVCTACRWGMPLTDYWLQPDNYLTELLAARFPFEHASALMFFMQESEYRGMIHSMKYHSRRDIAHALGRLYGYYLCQSPLYDDVTCLVPVPLHWTKRLKRGYNQSEELCRGMAESMGVRVDSRSLRRIRRTATQARKSRSDRWRNVEGAFGVKRPGAFSGGHILLVDDVVTTGSTIEACASAIVRDVEDVRLSVAALSVVRRTLSARSDAQIEELDMA